MGTHSVSFHRATASPVSLLPCMLSGGLAAPPSRDEPRRGRCPAALPAPMAGPPRVKPRRTHPCRPAARHLPWRARARRRPHPHPRPGTPPSRTPADSPAPACPELNLGGIARAGPPHTTCTLAAMHLPAASPTPLTRLPPAEPLPSLRRSWGQMCPWPRSAPPLSQEA